MGESYNTLAGLIQLNDRNLADYDINDILDSAPLLKSIYTQTASNGTLHKYLKQTGASSAAFRDANDGSTKTVSQDTFVPVTLKIIDATFSADVALAKAYKKGVDAYLEKELARSLRSAFAAAEKQIFYGTGADAKGFTGIIDGTGHDALADDMVISASGETANKQTSCFVMRHAEDGASFIVGEEGQFIVTEEPTVISVAGSGSGTLPAYYVPVTGWAGFQIGGAFDVARIANIDTGDLTSTSAFTDDHIFAAISKFKSDRQPNVIVMNRDALRLLRQSRTAVNPTGAPAMLPTDLDGIPIIVTDQIVSTEAVES